MHYRTLILVLSGILFLNTGAASAQKILSEGVLFYSITIDPPGGGEQVRHTGTYTITIKGNSVKKHLKVDNGFESTLVTDQDLSNAFSLKKMGDKDVAIQMDINAIKQRRKKYEGYRIRALDNKKQVAALNAEEAVVTYADNKSANIFYTNDWNLATDVFEHFPGIRQLPVEFAYTSEDGRVTHFNLQRVDIVPVQNAAFAIPKQAKIISNAEYEELKK